MTHKTCENCGKALAPAPSAPHKRFCSPDCRTQWWTRRRQEGQEALARKEKFEKKHTRSH
jgi:predicted nucleic acid-binding Zn ribbon protein